MPHKDPEVYKAYLRDYHQRHKAIKNPRRVLTSLKRRLSFVVRAGLTLRCARCSFEGHPAALHFHHRNPASKAFEIDKELRSRSRSDEEILMEIAKCDLICANCHAIEHASYAQEDVDREWSALEGVIGDG